MALGSVIEIDIAGSPDLISVAAKTQIGSESHKTNPAGGGV